MATQDDVRRIALALPEVTEREGHFGFDVAGRKFAGVYLERIHPRKARVPNPDGLAVPVSSEEQKFALITTNPEVYFTTDHYNGYATILLWLPRIALTELEDLLTDAWYLCAPKHLQHAFDTERGSTA